MNNLDFTQSNSDENKPLFKETVRIDHFYAQIRAVPNLFEKAKLIDTALEDQFAHLKFQAGSMVAQFNAQKAEILQKFDPALMPLAREILDSLLKDAEDLHEDLKQGLSGAADQDNLDWINHAKNWAKLYSKWHDREELVDTILKKVAERTEALISKDIQIIEDYQKHSLSKLDVEADEFIDLKNRLSRAVAEPMKQFMALKEASKEPASLKQASEWISSFQKVREKCFNQVLIKVDNLVKDRVMSEEPIHEELRHDFIGESAFIQEELREMEEWLPQIGEKRELNVFFQERLAGIKEHLEPFTELSLPPALKAQLDAIQERIQRLEDRVKSQFA